MVRIHEPECAKTVEPCICRLFRNLLYASRLYLALQTLDCAFVCPALFALLGKHKLDAAFYRCDEIGSRLSCEFFKRSKIHFRFPPSHENMIALCQFADKCFPQRRKIFFNVAFGFKCAFRFFHRDCISLHIIPFWRSIRRR